MPKLESLRRAVSAELVRRGYRRFDRMHLLAVSSDWYFWVDTGPLGKRADISPYVGIRYDPLEQLLSELLSLPRDDTVGSIGANVGYVLGGEYRNWSADADLSEVLTAIDTASQKLRPLMEREKLAEAWKIRGSQDPIWLYREIVLLVLRHDYKEVKAKLSSAAQTMCRHEDDMAATFRKFEERVRVMMSARGP